jgi:hypothetical protein
LNAIIMTCIKLLGTCTMFFCVQSMAHAHVLKYSSCFSNKLSSFGFISPSKLNLWHWSNQCIPPINYSPSLWL